jgi:hypothetical protein
MMLDFNKPIQTRDGRKVEILTSKGREPYPIVFYVEGQNLPQTRPITGKSLSNIERPSDLINYEQTP